MSGRNAPTLVQEITSGDMFEFSAKVQAEIPYDIEILNEIIKHLDSREQKVIQLYFGLEERTHTLQEIGDEFNITRERIRIIKERALRKILTSYIKAGGELLTSTRFEAPQPRPIAPETSYAPSVPVVPDTYMKYQTEPGNVDLSEYL